MYEERHYRFYSISEDLVSFRVIYGETDLFISCEKNLKDIAEKALKENRIELNKYISKNPNFETSLVPISYDLFAPKIAKVMIKDSSLLKVGPMASVAGAIADFVGKELLKYSDQVIVENGGDIFIKTRIQRKAGVFAGNSPFSEKVALIIEPDETPLGLCTSSGTVGHSLSFGNADAVVIKAATASLADAAATAVCNEIKSKNDIEPVIKKFSKRDFIKGILIIKDDVMAISGQMVIEKI